MLGLVTGTVDDPEIRISFPYDAIHAPSRSPLREYIKAKCDARWDKAAGQWVITGTPRHPDEFFAGCGITLHIDREAFPGVTSAEELQRPFGVLAPNGRQVQVHSRMTSRAELLHLLGYAAQWDREAKVNVIPVTDVYLNGQLRPQVEWSEEAQWAAYRALTAKVAVSGLEEQAEACGRVPSVDESFKSWFESSVASMPEWWDWDSREPFPHQFPGAYSAVLGHRLIADAPGVGKTNTAIMCAGLKRSKRILVVCPPKLSLNWGHEFAQAGYPHQIRVFRAGPLRKKDKEPLPDEGVVVVGDSLLASRDALRDQLIEWCPDFFVVDEIHRLKSLASKRTQAVLDVAHHVPVSGRYGLTGTPIISGPHELVPILEFTGHLGPVFGGAHAFLHRFCTYFEKFKSFAPRKHALPELHALLTRHIWVRRPKFEVLKMLSKPISSAIELDVDVSAYKEAHRQVIEKLEEWVSTFIGEWGIPPDEEAIESYLELNAVGHVSHLRLASAVTKLETATELIAEHVASDPDNESPLIVWVHHKEVQLALAEQLESEGVAYRMVVGGQSQKQSQESVDMYQDGQVQVLICSITAAGVGLTLTRGCEALFVETDWTPAIVSQAVDRQNRIGQTRAVITRTLVALGTLDEHIQRIQQKKGAIAGVVHGDDLSDVAVLHSQDLATPREIIRGLLEPIVKKMQPKIAA
ncbi:helicase-like protein [Leucobacter luti]|uniref:Helicase-like protein n=2 Tax=Leucobacter luti TaxID=340320 RepID=A0A4R6RRY0_9MICO|nr:helicase-like protein [Leucobacter luti]